MKINIAVLTLVVFTLPLPTAGQPPKEPSTPIMAGKDIATVQTESGKVRGYVHNGTFTFKGIPYAKAERFMAPTKPDSWTNVRSSMTYGPVCPTNQTTTTNDEFEFPFHHDWGYTNENCLSLNVWTPQLTNAPKQPAERRPTVLRPVMVWLHGGGFAAGSSVELPSYDGENLTKKGDVVVVSVNHRLNVLGFLDLSAYGDAYKNSANAGLMDLVAALQWVKANIAQFGGDPGNVTIFGQSGGGGKVTCLMNAPSAKGLFQKAIVQSGSYLTGFAEKSVTQKVSAALLDELKLQPNQVDSLQKIPYDVLNAASAKALKRVQDGLKAGDVPAPGGLSWGPVHDGNFLPYQLVEPAAIALANDIPLLVGSTKAEFTPFNPATRNLTMDGVKTALQKKYGDKTDAYLAAVKKAYPETVKPSDYMDIDLMFRPGTVRQANQKAIPGAAPVFVYLFTWSSPVLDGAYKSMHCMEIPFVFDNIARCEEMTGGGKDALALADKMSRAWLAFARTGNPGHKGLPPWPAYTPENGATMLFDTVNQVKNHPDRELLQIAAGKTM